MKFGHLPTFAEVIVFDAVGIPREAKHYKINLFSDSATAQWWPRLVGIYVNTLAPALADMPVTSFFIRISPVAPSELSR